MTVVVKIIAKADGSACKHSDRWVSGWNPHTPFGTCAVQTVADVAEAKRFESAAVVMEQWRTVSNREPTRPTDGRPNRPLTGLTIEIEAAP